jgi:hypothetical protein
VISPPVKRKVRRNSFTQPALSSGWWASSQAAKPPWLSRRRWRTWALWIAASIFRRLRMIPGIGQQALAVGLAVGGDPVHVEAVVGAAEAFALLQHGFPAQPGLVDLQQQALEQDALVALREAVFVVVVGPVQRVAGGEVAVAGHGARAWWRTARLCGSRPRPPHGR